jgi:hypothetical protein
LRSLLGPTLDVVLAFLQLQEELLTLGFPMQLTKCVTWFPQMLNHIISLLHGFLNPDLNFCILGTLVRSTSFVESFMVKALYKDLGMISSFLMFVDP